MNKKYNYAIENDKKTIHVAHVVVYMYV